MFRVRWLIIHTVIVMLMAARLFPEFGGGSGALFRASLPIVASGWFVMSFIMVLGIVIVLLFKRRVITATILALVATIYPAHFGLVMLGHGLIGMDLEILIYAVCLPGVYFCHAVSQIAFKRNRYEM